MCLARVSVVRERVRVCSIACTSASECVVVAISLPSVVCPAKHSDTVGVHAAH